jgi:AcrR family transcriptional regulator
VAAIEDAALALVGRDGFVATTAEQIAETAGISPRTFFRYCPTKIDALLAVSTEIEDDIAAELAGCGGPRTLAEVERAIAAVLVRTETERPASLDRLLRVRALIDTDDGLRDALLARDARHVLDLHVRWGGAVGQPVFAVPIALLTLRSAIDDWSRRRPTEPALRLSVCHGAAIERLRETVTGRR